MLTTGRLLHLPVCRITDMNTLSCNNLGCKPLLVWVLTGEYARSVVQHLRAGCVNWRVLQLQPTIWRRVVLQLHSNEGLRHNMMCTVIGGVSCTCVCCLLQHPCLADFSDRPALLSPCSHHDVRQHSHPCAWCMHSPRQLELAQKGHNMVPPTL